MDSFSKIPLSREIAESIVSAQFGAQRKLIGFQELKEGFFNAAALLELDDGMKCVLKAAPPDEVKVLRYEKDLMRAEVESMRLVRAQTSVPVPEIYAYDTSRRWLPSEYFLMSYLPGEPLHKLHDRLSDEQKGHIKHEMGRMTREISQITGSVFGYWAKPEAPGCTWRECFARMIEGVLLDGEEANVQLPLPYDEIRRRLTAHYDVLDEVTVPRLVHWDIWDGNVFVDPATGCLTGLIDFERVLWGDPLTESIFGDLNPDSHASIGYGDGVLRSPSQQTRRLLYNAYLFLIMVIECYYRFYSTDDQENWTRPRLIETLEKLA